MLNRRNQNQITAHFPFSSTNDSRLKASKSNKKDRSLFPSYSSLDLQIFSHLLRSATQPNSNQQLNLMSFASALGPMHFAPSSTSSSILSIFQYISKTAKKTQTGTQTKPIKISKSKLSQSITNSNSPTYSYFSDDSSDDALPSYRQAPSTVSTKSIGNEEDREVAAILVRIKKEYGLVQADERASYNLRSMGF